VGPAGGPGAGRGIRLGMAGDAERIELADDRKARPAALRARRDRLDAGHREPGLRLEPEAGERLLDEGGGLRLLEAELRIPADALAEADDGLGPLIDRAPHLALQLVPRHSAHPPRAAAPERLAQRALEDLARPGFRELVRER